MKELLSQSETVLKVARDSQVSDSHPVVLASTEVDKSVEASGCGQHSSRRQQASCSQEGAGGSGEALILAPTTKGCRA